MKTLRLIRDFKTRQQSLIFSFEDSSAGTKKKKNIQPAIVSEMEREKWNGLSFPRDEKG